MSNLFRRLPLRYLVATCALTLFGVAIAQRPAPKPAADDKKSQASTKAKAPRKKDDDPNRAGTLRPADLALEAEQTTEPAIRDTYLHLAVPHDLVLWVDGMRTSRVDVVYRFVDAQTDFREQLKLVPLDAKGKKGPATTATRGEIRRIEPYEEIALADVKSLLDPKGPARGVPRLVVLQAGERILTVVARFHESARRDRVREGSAWETIGQRLQDRLIQVQADMLTALAKADDWDRAYELAERLARVHRKKPDFLVRFAEPMSLFIDRLLQAEKYTEVYDRLKLLEEIFPGETLSTAVDKTRARKATDLFEKAKLEKDKARAVALLTTAENLWPRLPGLRDFRLHLSNAYPILYVGVPTLPENLSPATARTDAERWAVELLFEGLVRTVYEPDVGERHQSVLADRHSLIPLGREFTLTQAYWSDGKPVAGIDVRRTIQLLQKQGRAALLAKPELGSDAYHVRVMLTQGFIDPLALMTFKILPESARLESLDDPNFAKQPIGSGPFVFHKRDKTKVIFAANPNYRRPGKLGLPRIREVQFFHSKDPAGDFRQGRLHLLLDPEAVPGMVGGGGVKVHALPNRRVYFLAPNHRRKSLQNQELRRALALALNRTQILDEIFRAGLKDLSPVPHRPLNGPYPPRSWACPKNDLIPADLYAPSKAKALAGKAKGSGSINLTLKYPDGNAQVARACEMIRAQAGDAGIDLRLLPRTPDELYRDVEIDHDYDLAYYHWDFNSEAYLLWPLFDPKATARGGSNFLGFQPDADLQKCFHVALDHREFKRVESDVHEIHGIVNSQMPLIPLWQLDTLLALEDRVNTVPQPHALDPLLVLTDVEKWELKRE